MLRVAGKCLQLLKGLLVATYLEVHVVSLDDPADDCAGDVGEDLLDLDALMTAPVVLMAGSHPAKSCRLQDRPEHNHLSSPPLLLHSPHVAVEGLHLDHSIVVEVTEAAFLKDRVGNLQCTVHYITIHHSTVNVNVLNFSPAEVGIR